MKSVKNILLMLLGLAVGGAAGWVLASHAQSAGAMLLDFALLFAAVYAQMILHEAGHLLAGLATGYRFVSFRIGRLMCIRRAGRLRLARFSLAGTGGQCLMAPPPLRDGRYPNTLYHLGGVIMNLLCAALAGLLLGLCGYSAWRFGTLGAGLFLALTNGIPLRMTGLDNDGCNALRCRREENVRVGFYRQIQVNAALSDGGRLRDLPEEWFACAAGQEYERGYLRFQWLLDREAYAEARTYGETLRHARLPGIHGALLENDLRTLALLAGEAPAPFSPQAERLLRAMAGLPAVLRGQYILALLQEKDPEKANRIKTRFEKTGRGYPYPGDLLADRALMRLAEQKTDITSAPRG